MSAFSQWGLHLFHSSLYPGLEAGSYFVERPYASFLVFPPQSSSLNVTSDFDLIQSKGGLAYLFHVYQDRPNELQKLLYRRFGCPLICPWDDERFEKLMHEDYSFRYGKVGVDFYDHQVDFVTVNNGPALGVDKNGLSFLFLGAPFLLDRGQIRHAPTGKAIEKLALDEGQIRHFSDETYLIFQFFRGLNWSSASGVLF